jgi:hypothetical protein
VISLLRIGSEIKIPEPIFFFLLKTQDSFPMYSLAYLFCFVVISAVIAGCTAPVQKAAPTAPVKGKVTLDGKPMASGEIRFSTAGFPPNAFEIKDGNYSGTASIGKNHVEIVQMKQDGFTTTEPKTPIMVNAVADKFSGPGSTLSAEVPKDGKDFDFQVTSK